MDRNNEILYLQNFDEKEIADPQTETCNCCGHQFETKDLTKIPTGRGTFEYICEGCEDEDAEINELKDPSEAVNRAHEQAEGMER